MNLRQKARDLVELAADERTPDKERLAAAMKAVALIRKHDLLSSPLDAIIGSVDNETIQETVSAAKTIYDRLTDPDLIDSFRKLTRKKKRSRRR